MLEEPGKQQEREGRSATDKWEKTEDRTEQNLEPEAENTEGVKEPESEEEEETYSFMQETVKDEQKTPQQFWAGLWKTAGRGILFGLSACLAFCALKPWAESWFGRSGVVSIPQDEEPAAEEDTQEEEPAAEEETAQPELTVDSYREMSDALYQVAATAARSVVEVEGITGEESWTGQEEDKQCVSGVIFADTGGELLIAGSSRAAEGATGIVVTFQDRVSYEAYVKKQDRNLGIAVYGVTRSLIADSTWNQIQVAVLGNSNLMGKGDTVIALGRQFGYPGGTGYGIVSSTRNRVNLADGEFTLLDTDIAAAEGGSGILFNLSGEVVGLADQEIQDDGKGNLVTSYAISGIKSYIELLSNGNAVPYLGVRGVEVDSALSSQEGIPEGIYVQEVEADSPAMQAGIQSGDVITEIAGTDISSLTGYKNALQDCTPGQEIRVRGRRQGAEGYVSVSFSVTVGSRE